MTQQMDEVAKQQKADAEKKTALKAPAVKIQEAPIAMISSGQILHKDDAPQPPATTQQVQEEESDDSALFG